MEQSLRVPSKDTPTLFNKELVIGALVGMFFSPAPFTIAVLTPTMIGASIGGWLGRNRMMNEMNMGKKLDKPSFFNKELVIGVLGTLAAMMIGVDALEMLPEALQTASLGLPLVGALVGGSMGKSRQEKEYSQGIQTLEELYTQRAQNVAQSMGRGTGQGEMRGKDNPYYNSVTPAETQLMMARMHAGPEPDHRMQIELARLEAKVNEEQSMQQV